MIERAESGISGLDRIIDGGFPENYLILLSGGCGTGKTIFGLQFLCNVNEPGIFVSFGESIEQLSRISKSFGWDTEKLERSKKFLFLKYDPFRLEDIFEFLESNFKETSCF